MRYVLPLLLCLAVLTLVACGTVKKTAQLLTPETSSLEQIAPGLNVEPQMTKQQRKTLTGNIGIARQRIHLYFGSVAVEPTITACATEKCFQDNGGVAGRAKAYGATKVLLSPRDLTAPAIAHEWSHAELHTRVGGARAAKEIPRWFDEGLAAMISNDPDHSEEAWQAIKEARIATPALKEMENAEKWQAAVKKYGNSTTNKEQYKVLYATAAHEVRRWYRKAGKMGLTQLIESVRQGKSFIRAYQEAQGKVSPARSSAAKISALATGQGATANQ